MHTDLGIAETTLLVKFGIATAPPLEKHLVQERPPLGGLTPISAHYSAHSVPTTLPTTVPTTVPTYFFMIKSDVGSL